MSRGPEEVREPRGSWREEHTWVKGLWAYRRGTSEGRVVGMREGR